jgi:hypothetical protein
MVVVQNMYRMVRYVLRVADRWYHHVEEFVRVARRCVVSNGGVGSLPLENAAYVDGISGSCFVEALGATPLVKMHRRPIACQSKGWT